MADNNNIGLIELLLIDSRITPTSNGAVTNGNISVNSQITSGQKWWAAVILGFIFFLISSSVAYNITSQITVNTIGTVLIYGAGPTLTGLLFHTFIFILVVRLILW